MSMLSNFSPSLVYDGLVDDERCPLMIGAGFGPNAYHKLFEKWTTISAKCLKDYSELQKGQVVQFLLKIRQCDPDSVSEGTLSGVIAAFLQRLMQCPEASGCDSFSVLHQVFTPCKPASSVGVAVMNFNMEPTAMHALLEIKWRSSAQKFPEAQAAAYARYFCSPFSNWLPVGVVTKTSLLMGVAFEFLPNRWAFSQIFEYQNESYVSSNEEDVLWMLKFSEFLFASAAFHKSNPIGRRVLVDCDGRELLENFEVLGDRVLGGTQDGNPKVLKFFGNVEAATQAMERQSELKDCIGISPGMRLCKGCGARNALCAVQYDRVQYAMPIEHSHLKDLTEKVAAIHAKGFVHGDLRPQNILPCADGTVTLIDLEWAGRHGVAEFPRDVNVKAFGEKARKKVMPQNKIDPFFDWLCLADIFLHVGCNDAALAALAGNKGKVVAALDAHQRQPQNIVFTEALGYLESPPKYLNLSALDQRVSNYYKAISRGRHEPTREPMPGGGEAIGGARKRGREPSSEWLANTGPGLVNPVRYSRLSQDTHRLGVEIE